MYHSFTPLVDLCVLTDIGGRRPIDASGPCVSNEMTTTTRGRASEFRYYIHDACHSWLPDPNADFGLVSFYPTKLVPGAEGGAVFCRNTDDARRLREWLYCGLTPGTAASGICPSVPGRKANMTDVAAELNREALALAPDYICAIEKTWMRMASMAAILGVPYRDQPVRPYLFQIEFGSNSDMVGIMAAMRRRGISVARNFRPAPLLTVPCYPEMDADTLSYILRAVREYL